MMIVRKVVVLLLYSVVGLSRTDIYQAFNPGSNTVDVKEALLFLVDIGVVVTGTSSSSGVVLHYLHPGVKKRYSRVLDSQIKERFYK